MPEATFKPGGWGSYFTSSFLSDWHRICLGQVKEQESKPSHTTEWSIFAETWLQLPLPLSLLLFPATGIQKNLHGVQQRQHIRLKVSDFIIVLHSVTGVWGEERVNIILKWMDWIVNASIVCTVEDIWVRALFQMKCFSMIFLFPLGAEDQKNLSGSAWWKERMESFHLYPSFRQWDRKMRQSQHHFEGMGSLSVSSSFSSRIPWADSLRDSLGSLFRIIPIPLSFICACFSVPIFCLA